MKFMQKKCKQSCCERAELQSVDSERRSGILCDLENNLFNDDITPPPMNEMDEILMNEITCDNFAELKVISRQYYTADTNWCSHLLHKTGVVVYLIIYFRHYGTLTK